MTEGLYWAEVILVAACLTRFGWGMFRGFVRPHGLTLRMALSGASGFLAGVANAVVIAWFNPVRPLLAWAGLVLYALAWGLFEWAVRTTRGRPLSFVFAKDLPVHLLTRGPYALVRHPFYTAYLLAWTGGVVMTGQVLLVVPLLVTFGWYNATANFEEAKFAASPLAADYAAYRARTGKFLPASYQLSAKPENNHG
jgi:protein-S-isoprenylcysteine O-methyltransferase Ste14